LHHLVRRRRPQAAELYQAQKLYEVRPQQPNEHGRVVVSDIAIPGHGW
jgi:hypothetical protein